MEFKNIAINFYRDQTINETIDMLIPYGYVFTSSNYVKPNGDLRLGGLNQSARIKEILRRKLMFDGEGAAIILGTSYCKMEWCMVAGTFLETDTKLIVTVDEFIENYLNFEYELYKDKWKSNI